MRTVFQNPPAEDSGSEEGELPSDHEEPDVEEDMDTGLDGSSSDVKLPQATLPKKAKKPVIPVR